MSTKNPWLTPFERSFQDIKDKVIAQFKILVPEVTNFSETNIFVRLISVFSAMVETMHYYIDSIAREAFFMSARKYSSLIKHAKFLDYNVKSANPASVDVFLYASDGKTVVNDIFIPASTTFTSKGGTIFTTYKDQLWKKGTYGIKIPLVQKSPVSNVTFGTVVNEDVIITLGELGSGNLYCEGSMALYIINNNITETWTLVDTFAYSKSTDKHYKVTLGSNQEPIIVFGNGRHGAKPAIGSIVKGSYYVTMGSLGNIPINQMVTVPSAIYSQAPNSSYLACNNSNKASGGTDYEDFNMLKEHVPLHVRTLGVAISENDFTDLAKTLPGVDKAFTKQICGKSISVYITPDGGGLASQALLDDTKLRLLRKKVLGTSISVLPAGESLIYINATITGRPSFKSLDIDNQVTDSLISLFDYNTSDIGKPVRLSELYAIIEGLSMVDYLSITNLYLKPIPIPLSGSTYLNLDIELVNLINEISYLLRFNSILSSFEIININGTSTGVSVPYSGQASQLVSVSLDNNQWSIRILPSELGEYDNGSLWKIKLYRNNVDQISPELNIPLIKSKSQLKLTIIEKI